MAASEKRRVLLTGATGFVGSNTLPVLAAAGWEVRPAARRPGLAGVALIPHVDGDTDWSAALDGCSAVVHLAGWAHVPRGESAESCAAVNTDGTLRLARQAAAAGVELFVFVSTVKVHGEGGPTPYAETDAPAPADLYARSKWRAEQGLAEIAAATGMAVVVLRPPLIFGPGVRGNFFELVRLVDRGIPLPIGAIRNRRSVLSVANMASAIVTVLSHPAAAGRTYLLAEPQDLSTPELVREIADAIGRAALLVPVPAILLEAMARLIGRHDTYQRLASSLFVDSSLILDELGWTPPFTTKQGFDDLGAWYRR